MRFAIWVLMTGVTIGVASGAAARLNGAGRDGWDRDAVARYLDDRMDLWFSNATKLRTGDAGAPCISCHTSVPYALARPALRRSMGAGAAVPQEVKLVETAAQRVETYASHQLMYEMSESKKAESRGTEAVLNALILVSADAAGRVREPGVVTQKAFARLWELQRPDGAWDWLNFKLEPYETIDAVYYGATLAAFAVGMSPDFSAGATAPDARSAAGVAKLRAYLSQQFAGQRLYNRTWALLASTRMNGVVTNAERTALVAEIRKRQRGDGGWSLYDLGPWRWSSPAPPFKAPGTLDENLLGQSDGFATGLMVYALERAGLSADPAVGRGVTWLRANLNQIQIGDNEERPRAAWRAYSLNVDREHGGGAGEPLRRLFMSDAATAFAVLALTESE